MRKDVTGLAALFATTGVLHAVRPRPFERIVPKALPHKRLLVHVSGALELGCAMGLLHPRTRRAAGLVSTGLLVAVFPANVQMAVDARCSSSVAYRAGTLARLPLQAPLVRVAWKAATS